MDDIGADDAALMEELPPGAVAEPDEEPPTELHQWKTRYELLRERHDKLKADRAKFVEKAGRLAKKVAIQDDFLKVEGAGGGSRGRQLEILQTELDRRDRENALLKRKLGRAALQAKDAPSLSQHLDAANPAARFGAAHRPRSPARPGSLSTEAARLVALEGELAKLKAKQRSDQTDLRRTREELVRLGKMNQALRANSKRARKERVDIARAGAYADASALAAEQRGAPDDVRRHVPPDPVMKFSNPASMLAGAGPSGPATPSAVEHTFGGTRLVEDALRRAAAEVEGVGGRRADLAELRLERRDLRLGGVGAGRGGVDLRPELLDLRLRDLGLLLLARELLTRDRDLVLELRDQIFKTQKIMPNHTQEVRRRKREGVRRGRRRGRAKAAGGRREAVAGRHRPGRRRARRALGRRGRRRARRRHRRRRLRRRHRRHLQ